MRRQHYLRYGVPLAPVLALVGISAGCSSALETGYAYRPLGSTSTERRGYYASPFTPEAAAAAQSRSDPGADVRSMRRPTNAGVR